MVRRHLWLAAAVAAALCPWSAASAAPAPSSFDSLLAAAAIKPGLLERAVIERNPTLAAAAATVAEARARADAAGSLMSPTLDGMVAPRAIGNEDIVAPGYQVGLSQSLPLFGKRGAERSAAKAEARAAGEDLRSARLDLIREARTLYYSYFLAERGLEVNRELVDLLQRFRSVAVEKYAAGTAGQQ